MKKKANNESNSVDKLVELLKNDPSSADKLLKLLTEPEKQREITSSEVETTLKNILAGKPVELEKGPIVGQVWQGLSVCGICGREQKTHTSNPQGLVTQHICITCNTHMGLLKTDSEKFTYMQNGLANNYLSAAQTKFKIMLKRFKAVREKEEIKNANPEDGPNPFDFTATGEEK